MTTTPTDELKDQVKHLIFGWMGGTNVGDPVTQYKRIDAAADEMMSLFNKALEAREIDIDQAGHWYVGAYIPRDANDFKPRHKCQCGYSSRDKETIIQHIQWKLAELSTPPKTKEES